MSWFAEGGRSWSDAPTPSLPSRHAAPLTSLRFPSPSNATGSEFAEALREAQVPFNQQGAYLYKRSEVESVIALMRLVVNAKDDAACRRAIKGLKLKLTQETADELERRAAASDLGLYQAAVDIAADRSGSTGPPMPARQRKEVEKLCACIRVLRSAPSRSPSSPSSTAASTSSATSSAA